MKGILKLTIDTRITINHSFYVMKVPKSCSPPVISYHRGLRSRELVEDAPPGACCSAGDCFLVHCEVSSLGPGTLSDRWIGCNNHHQIFFMSEKSLSGDTS